MQNQRAPLRWERSITSSLLQIESRQFIDLGITQQHFFFFSKVEIYWYKNLKETVWEVQALPQLEGKGIPAEIPFREFHVGEYGQVGNPSKKESKGLVL